MNISNRLRQNFVFPAAGFEPFPPLYSYMTHGNQVVTDNWRIDGATFGVRFWAVPESLLPTYPNRIDVVIPDQTEWPAELWEVLDARDSTHMSDHRVADLGISRHLRKALNHWWTNTPGIKEQYQNLPFGSSIRVPRITADVTQMEFNLVPNSHLEKNMLSADELRNMWEVDTASMPPTVDVTALRFERQLQKSVTLVSLEGHGLLIFKSRTNTPSGLYNELKVLLTIPQHPNIIARPAFLVTTQTSIHEGPQVCGLLLEYHKAGALQEALPKRKQEGALRLQDQVRWAKEVTMALMHIQSVPGQFYSDLKMDNILLSNTGNQETAILADFEQSRNFYNWAPPEVYYLEWIAELGCAHVARSPSTNTAVYNRFATVLQDYLKSKGQDSIPIQPEQYDNPPHGWYFPWLFSSAAEKEADEVYCLGRVLWCIFEGAGDADNILGRSIPIESERRFPEFQNTPAVLQPLIKHCTAGAREWKDGPISIIRKEGRVYPMGRTGENGEPTATLEETQQAIRSFWQKEMEKAVEFVSAKIKYDEGQGDEKDIELLDYLRRPTLKEVLDSLESLSSAAL